MLEDNALEDVRDILTSVGPFLDGFVDLFPFDDGNRIFFLVKQS